MLKVRQVQAHSKRCKAADGSKLYLQSTETRWLTAEGHFPRGGKLGPVLWFVVECSGGDGSGRPGACCRFYGFVSRDSIVADTRQAFLVDRATRAAQRARRRVG